MSARSHWYLRDYVVFCGQIAVSVRDHNVSCVRACVCVQLTGGERHWQARCEPTASHETQACSSDSSDNNNNNNIRPPPSDHNN